MIADSLGIDPKTLRDRHRDDINRGALESAAEPAKALYRMACSGKDLQATIFWLRSRAGWNDRPQPTYASGSPDDPPMPVGATAMRAVVWVDNGRGPRPPGTE